MDMEGIEQVPLFSIDVLVSYTTSPFAQTLIRRDNLYLESLAQNYVICFYARIFFSGKAVLHLDGRFKGTVSRELSVHHRPTGGFTIHCNKNLKVFQDGADYKIICNELFRDRDPKKS